MKSRARRIGATSREYWEERYKAEGNSGDGSYGSNGQFKIDVLNTYFDKIQPLGVLDFGVGDFTYFSVFTGRNFKFFGLDISPTKVVQLKHTFGENAEFSFATTIYDFDDALYDHAISLDVIFHLVEDSTYTNYINHITRLPIESIVIYSSNFNDNKWELHVRHRRFVPDILSRGFELIEYIPNPTHSTDSDFYFFKRISSNPRIVN